MPLVYYRRNAHWMKLLSNQVCDHKQTIPIFSNVSKIKTLHKYTDSSTNIKLNESRRAKHDSLKSFLNCLKNQMKILNHILNVEQYYARKLQCKVPYWLFNPLELQFKLHTSKSFSSEASVKRIPVFYVKVKIRQGVFPT
ncbi:hypothetical protein T06_11205 [Trichinella sp. T6]|nr:hypothetical protein T06_11205 [Trichinella sp. T6]